MLKRTDLLNIGCLTVNRACNNRCRWCYAQDTDFTKSEMPLETARKLLLICKDCGVGSINILGGEPTLYANLTEVIKITRDYGMDPSIVTNGRAFAKKKFVQKIAASGLKNLNVSIKAGSKKDYISFTGADGYDQMVTGFKNLQDADFDASASVTFNRELMKSYNKIIETIILMGAKKIIVEFCNPIIVNNSIVEVGAPNPQEIVAWTNTIFNALLSTGVDFAINPNIPLCFFTKTDTDKMIEADSLIGGCHMRCGNVLIFLPNGDLIPCHQFTDNILAEFKKDFFDSNSFKTFLENDPSIIEFYKISSFLPAENCANCNDWKKCGGGCLVKSFHYAPSNYVPQL